MLLRFTPLAALVGLGALIACGSLSDPEKVVPAANSAAPPNSATDPPSVITEKVSGALTGASTGTHVALVWRNHSVLVVGADVALDASGNFTMNLTPPPADYVNTLEVDGSEDSGVTPIHTQDLNPLDTVQGTTTPSGTPFTFALAAFLAYQDANGDGQLDLDGASGATPDTILGGAPDLVVDYYAGGNAFDYEKLRANGTTPHAGFNVHYLPADSWVGLDALTLAPVPDTGFVMPESVCGPVPVFNTQAAIDTSHGPYLGYPELDGVTCSADGHSFSVFGIAWNWRATVCMTVPSGVCRGLRGPPLGGVCTSAPSGSPGVMPPGAALPPGWPCTADGHIANPIDGGI